MNDELFSLENLYQAYRACRRRKRGTFNALRFEANLLENLCDLRDELTSRTYHPTTSICFVQKRPKMREIFAADFRDRVVHHLLVGYLEPLFERIFIHDSYACRRGKGVHAAIARLKAFVTRSRTSPYVGRDSIPDKSGRGAIRDSIPEIPVGADVWAPGMEARPTIGAGGMGGVSKRGNGATTRAWYMKEDIAGFFMSIDKEVLFDLVCRKVKREDVQWLARTVIFHDCTRDYRFKGDPSLLGRIPPHKTLFKVPEGKGLPIGNLTSQFFANVYLNELDQFVKRSLRCRYYIRYCDDFLLLAKSPEDLAAFHSRIEAFLKERLLLKLNQRQHRIAPVSSGIDFLGYVAHPHHILVRRRVVGHFRERLDRFEAHLRERTRGEISAWRYPPEVMARLRSVVSSYLGHFRWADSHKLVSSSFQKHAVLRAGFMLRNGRLIPRYLQEKSCRTIQQGYRWWVPRALPEPRSTIDAVCPLWVRASEDPKVLVFFPVGSFYELYDAQAECARDVLGLKPVPGLRGFKIGCGFHRRWLAPFLKKSRDKGFHVALLRQEKRVDGSCFRRLAKLFRGRASGVMEAIRG